MDNSLLHRWKKMEKSRGLPKDFVIVSRKDWEKVRLMLKLGEDIFEEPQDTEDSDILNARDLLPNFTMKGSLSIAPANPYQKSTTTLVNAESMDTVIIAKVVKNGEDT